jgi:hypothetical protein
MFYYLSITILGNPHNSDSPYYSFLCQATHIKWIYVLSDDQNLLQMYKNKLETMTPTEVLSNISIDIGQVDHLDDVTKMRNKLAQKKYKNDFFYPEGIVNVCDKSEKYLIDDFTETIWKGPGGLNITFDKYATN